MGGELNLHCGSLFKLCFLFLLRVRSGWSVIVNGTFNISIQCQFHVSVPTATWLPWWDHTFTLKSPNTRGTAAHLRALKLHCAAMVIRILGKTVMMMKEAV